MATGLFQPKPLEQETRSAIPTRDAAFHVSRATQTLRTWATSEDSPLRPIRVKGRLLWPTAAIRELLGVTA